MLHQNFSVPALAATTHTIIMARSAHKHSKTKKGSDGDGAATSFVAVDKKAFDPNVASLFASSVRIHTNSGSSMIAHCMLTWHVVGTSEASSQVALP